MKAKDKAYWANYRAKNRKRINPRQNEWRKKKNLEQFNKMYQSNLEGVCL